MIWNGWSAPPKSWRAWLRCEQRFALQAALGTPAEVFDIAAVVPGSNTQIFNWNGQGNNDITLGAFKVTTDPDSTVPLETIEIPDGETVTAQITGTLEAGTNTGGMIVEITNTFGALSYNVIDQAFVANTDWQNLSYNQLTQQNQAQGVFGPGPGSLVFSAQPGQGFVDLTHLHDPEPQNARLAALEQVLNSGTSTAELVDPIQHNTARAATIIGSFVAQ